MAIRCDFGRKKLVHRLPVFSLLFLCFLGAAAAQDPRGSMTGIVLDPQGGRIPGAELVVTADDTGVVHRLLSNDAGAFELQLLNPGKYSVSVEMQGFKKAVYPNLELSVADRLDLVCRLEMGEMTESVVVTDSTPLLETSSASGGRVVTGRELLQLPFNDMNPLWLSVLGAGMQWTGSPGFLRPFDNGGMSSFNTMGNVGSNMYTLDSIPVGGFNRLAGFAPPADSVSEFKLETTPFDASYGNSSGASINISSKAGTSALHGSVFNQHWQQRWNAMTHFARIAYEQQLAAGTISKDQPRQQSGRSNNFGGSVGGPVYIPKLLKQKDRLFFFLSYNGIYQRATEDSLNTVPDPAWNQGDFSRLLAVDPTRYTLYDPRTARLEGSRVVRSAFAGNKGVPALSPVYKAYAKMYPTPNNIAGIVTADGRYNYFTSARTIEDFNSIINRYDYNLNDRHRMFFRWYRNQRWNGNGDWTYTTVPGLQAGGGVRNNIGAGVNWTWTVTSKTVLDASLGWNRYNHGNRRPVQAAFKPTDVGLPQYLDTYAGDYHHLPALDFNTMNGISQAFPGKIAVASAATGDLKIGLYTIKGNHSLKYGWIERRYWYAQINPGYTAGLYQFDNRYVKKQDNDTVTAHLGLEWASFMMGLPYSIQVDNNDTALWSTRYRSLYLQDNWRIRQKINLSFGLRYEREGGISERFHRGISGAFFYDDSLPFSTLVEAAYAASPLAELPASQFKVRGGIRYMGSPEKGYTGGTHNFLPRVGLAWTVTPRTVIRGGFGMYADTFNSNNNRPSQDGFSQSTVTTVSNDLGLTFCCGTGSAAGLSSSANPLVDPFPIRADKTRYDTPYGTTRGVAAFAGRSYSGYPRDFRPSMQYRASLGVQRQFSQDIVVKASVNSSYSNIWVAAPINYLPARYWATGNVRDNTVDTDMNTNVKNPFSIAGLASLQQSAPALYRYLSTQSTFTGSTIRKNQLLRPFPVYSSFTGLRPGVDIRKGYGGTWYHDIELEVEKRFSHGLQTSLSYAYSSSATQDVYLNEFDTAPSWEANSSIRPNRVVWSAIYELPFGKDRRWLQSHPLRHVAGNWQLSWIYQFQDGPVLAWGNRFFYGDQSQLKKLMNHDTAHAQDIHVWFDPNIAYKGSGTIPSGFTGFEGRSANQPGSYHVRVFPTRINGIQADGIRLWDIKVMRKFPIHESLKANFSVDFLNALNRTNFGAPNTNPTSTSFGKVTSQNGSGRILQFNLRVDF